MRYAIIPLLLGLLTGCGSPADIEPELLYRTYTVAETNVGVGNRQSIVEFTRQGNVLFGPNKEVAVCCAPARFTMSDRNMVFLGPETPNPLCAIINCRPSDLSMGVTWEIERLTQTQLVLALRHQRIVLTAQP